MTDKFIFDYIALKKQQNSEFIRYSYYELKIKSNLSDEEIDKFLKEIIRRVDRKELKENETNENDNNEETFITKMLYYNTKLNTFIEKAGDINYLIKYGRVVFNVKDLAQYVKDSIYINPCIDNDINNIYEQAKNICEENNINYNDDFIPYYNDVPKERFIPTYI